MEPFRTYSEGEAKYVLTFVDDYSRYVVSYVLKKESEFPGKIKAYEALYENQWSWGIVSSEF